MLTWMQLMDDFLVWELQYFVLKIYIPDYNYVHSIFCIIPSRFVPWKHYQIMPNFSLDCAYSKTFPGSILLPPPVSYAADELTSRECTVPGALNSVERMAMAEVLLLQFFFLSNWTTFEIFVVDFARGSVCFRHAKFVPKTKGNDVSHWVPSGETISWRTRINWLYVMNLSLKGFRTTSKIWRKCCKASSIVFFLLRDIIQKRNTHTLTLQ